MSLWSWQCTMTNEVKLWWPLRSVPHSTPFGPLVCLSWLQQHLCVTLVLCVQDIVVTVVIVYVIVIMTNAQWQMELSCGDHSEVCHTQLHLGPWSASRVCNNNCVTLVSITHCCYCCHCDSLWLIVTICMSLWLIVTMICTMTTSSHDQITILYDLFSECKPLLHNQPAFIVNHDFETYILWVHFL